MANISGTGDISISIKALNQAAGGIDAAKRDLEGLEKKTGSTSQKMRKQWEQNIRVIRQATLVVAAFGTAAGYALYRAQKAVIGTSAEFEAFQVQLESITGSADRARQIFEETVEFAAKTPFEVGELVEVRALLESVGITGIDAVESIGNAAAAMNRNIGDTGLALISMEKEVLRRYGITLNRSAEEATFIWTEASGKQRELVVANNDRMLRSTLLTIWNERYAGGMERFSSSWKGMTSNLDDAWEQFKARIGEMGFFDEMKRELSDLLDTIERLKENGKLDEWAKDASDALIELKDTIIALYPVAAFFARRVLDIGRGFNFFGDAIGTLVADLSGADLRTALERLNAEIAFMERPEALQFFETASAWQAEYNQLLLQRVGLEAQLRQGRQAAQDAAQIGMMEEALKGLLGQAAATETLTEAEKQYLQIVEQVNKELAARGETRGGGALDIPSPEFSAEKLQLAINYYDTTNALRDREVQSLIALMEVSGEAASKTAFYERQKIDAVNATAQVAGQAYGFVANQLALLIATGEFSAKAFAAAMFNMAADAVLAVGQQAAVKAVFALAEGYLFGNPKAFAAAALYGQVAAIAGAIGVALKSSAIAIGGPPQPAQPVYTANPYTGAPTSTSAVTPPVTAQPTVARPQLTIVIERVELLGDDSIRSFAEKISEQVRDYDVILEASTAKALKR